MVDQLNSSTKKAVRVAIFPYSKTSENPYLDQLSSELEKLNVTVEALSYRQFFLSFFLGKDRPEILHLQWLHAFLGRTSLLKSVTSASLFLSQLLVLKLIGVKIVWTAHNLKNHENRFYWLDKFGTTVVAKLANAVVAHCETAKTAIASYLSLTDLNKIHVVPHANYIACYENKLTRSEAREQLSLSDTQPVFLFLGQIRPYKGVAELVEAFNEALSQLPNSDAKLLIAGKLWEEDLPFRSLIQQEAEKHVQIDLIARFIPDNQLQLYFNACDVVVFPYKDILTSGAVMLAISFGKACIAPKLGCIGETLEEAGSFLYHPDESNGLSNAIFQAIERQSSLLEMGNYNFQLSKRYSGRKIAEMTKCVYQI